MWKEEKHECNRGCVNLVTLLLPAFVCLNLKPSLRYYLSLFTFYSKLRASDKYSSYAGPDRWNSQRSLDFISPSSRSERRTTPFAPQTTPNSSTPRSDWLVLLTGRRFPVCGGWNFRFLSNGFRCSGDARCPDHRLISIFPSSCIWLYVFSFR